MSLESRQLLNLSKLYREKVAEDKDWGYDKDGNSLNPKDKKKKLKTKDTVDEAIGTAIATGAALGIAAGGAALIPKVKKFGQNLKNKAQQRTQMKTEEKKAVKDFDGDGKLESPEDEYKGSKDKAIKKAIRKESFSNWREDLKEVPNYEQIPIDAKDRNKKIEEKNVKNKVKINPEMKEAVKYYKGDDRNPTTGLPKGLKPDKRKPGDKPMTAPPYNLAKANEEVSEEKDKAFEYVKKQIAAKYGKSGYVSKDNPRKPQTAAEKKKVRAHQAKVDKENAAARAKDPSQGRYPKG